MEIETKNFKCARARERRNHRLPLYTHLQILKPHTRFLSANIGYRSVISLFQVVKVQWFAFYNHTALERVACKQSGVLGFYNLEGEASQVFYVAYPVGLPGKAQAITRNQ